jgi:hypothetical protein
MGRGRREAKKTFLLALNNQQVAESKRCPSTPCAAKAKAAAHFAPFLRQGRQNDVRFPFSVEAEILARGSKRFSSCPCGEPNTERASGG